MIRPDRSFVTGFAIGAVVTAAAGALVWGACAWNMATHNPWSYSLDVLWCKATSPNGIDHSFSIPGATPEPTRFELVWHIRNKSGREIRLSRNTKLFTRSAVTGALVPIAGEFRGIGLDPDGLVPPAERAILAVSMTASCSNSML